MKKQYKDNIIRLYPELLDSEYAELKLLIMDGWYSLLVNTLQELSQFPIIITKICEFQGRLSVEFMPTRSLDLEVSNHIQLILNLAATKSATLCSECGKPGKTISNQSGIFTLCKDHQKEFE